MTNVVRLDVSGEEARVPTVYWPVLTMLVTVQLARVLGNSCRLVVFTVEESSGDFPPSQWWTALDIRSISWLLVTPLLAWIVVWGGKRTWGHVAGHAALLTLAVLFSGTVAHRLAFSQSVQREKVVDNPSTDALLSGNRTATDSVEASRRRAVLIPQYESATRRPVSRYHFWVRESVIGLTDYALLAILGYAVMYYWLSEQRSRQAERLRGLLMESRHDALSARLTHHFLFNTLNSISALTLTDDGAARSCIGKLGELLRASIDALPRGEVRLDEELRNLEIYLSLQKTRFGERLSYTIEIEPGLGHALVPAFLLQPLVENSFEHGFAEHVRDAKVWVIARRLDKECQIEVMDNGIEIRTDCSIDERYGLGVTRERLQLQYGGVARVELEPNQPSGLRVMIRIPYRTETQPIERAR
jgi:two-component sensor histidine kinase